MRCDRPSAFEECSITRKAEIPIDCSAFKTLYPRVSTLNYQSRERSSEHRDQQPCQDPFLLNRLSKKHFRCSANTAPSRTNLGNSVAGVAAYKHVSFNRASYRHGEIGPFDGPQHLKSKKVDRKVFNTFLPFAIMASSTHLESFTSAAFPK